MEKCRTKTSADILTWKKTKCVNKFCTWRNILICAEKVCSCRNTLNMCKKLENMCKSFISVLTKWTWCLEAVSVKIVESRKVLNLLLNLETPFLPHIDHTHILLTSNSPVRSLLNVYTCRNLHLTLTQLRFPDSIWHHFGGVQNFCRKRSWNRCFFFHMISSWE